MPTYWLGLVVLFLFARDIGAFPVVGGAGTYVPLSESPSAWLESLVLPWIVLAAAFAGLYARMIGENLREAMAQDYVRTARAKGLGDWVVIMRHAWRNALLPVITLLGYVFVYLVEGSIVVETVFSWPGMGAMAVSALTGRDYTLVMAIVLLSAVAVMLGTLLSDILYAVADPRVRYS